MATISSGRKALVLKRLSKIDKVVSMVSKVKGLDCSIITTACDAVRDQLDEIPLKGGGKSAPAKKGKKKPVESDLL